MNNKKTAILLKDLRHFYQYTIKKIATLLGVSPAAVSKWENGDNITTEHLYALSKIYNVSFSELYNGEINKNNLNYWKAYYNLSNYDMIGEINNKNVSDLKIFFEHCNSVKKRFLELLPEWASDNLTENELEEFLKTKIGA